MASRLIERVGIGTDIHRLQPGGPLRLGGVEIPFDHGSLGHSDGDVLLHAVMDAILGAAGLPDIGERFPDNDDRYRGVDSGALLSEVVVDVGSRGWALVNVDVVVHAERPKLSVHKGTMRDRVAGLLGVLADRVSIKAKTNEGLDAVGCGEAISCTCVVGLCRSPGSE